MVDLETTPMDDLLPERVAAAARSFGDRDAVRSASSALSYAELQVLSEGVASQLCERGVRPGDRLAISVPRDARLVPLILGILAAGAAFVPLEIRQPPTRAQFICGEADVAFLIADGAVAADLGLDAIARIEPLALLEGAAPPPCARVPLPQSTAYVMFTSGSTGKPKGVAVPHAGLANLVSWAASELGAERLRRTLFSTSLSFDVALFELFSPLVVGGSVNLVDGPFDIASVHPGLAPTLYSMVPSVAAELVSESRFQAGAAIVLAGEQVPAALVAALLHAGAAEVWNCYGPTEATVYATFARLAEGDERPPIGRPLSSTRAHVLDPRLEPVRSGDRGELFLAGAGVAQGYVNRPAMTADRFLPEPGAHGARMYRTGDVVRCREDGQLEFLGRTDDQLKVNGVRIEPAEIESALLRHEAVAAAVVGCYTPDEGAPILVAYVRCAAATDPTQAEMLGHLRSRLPREMLPSRVVILDALPRTLSGKVDRRALPAPPEESGPAVAWQQPSHRLVADAWEVVLEAGARFGPDDNFFDVGGHSFLLMRLKSELTRRSGTQLRLVDTFRYPTVRSMGDFLDGEAPALAPERAASIAGDRLTRLRRARAER